MNMPLPGPLAVTLHDADGYSSAAHSSYDLRAAFVFKNSVASKLCQFWTDLVDRLFSAFSLTRVTHLDQLVRTNVLIY